MVHRLVVYATAIVVSLAIALASSAPAIAAQPGHDFGPSVVPTRLDLQLTTRILLASNRGMRRDDLSWRGPNRMQLRERIRTKWVHNDFTTDYAGSRLTMGGGPPWRLLVATRTNNYVPVEPGRIARGDAQMMEVVWPLVVRMRSGEHVLKDARMNGRAVLRATTKLAAVRCIGDKAGTRTVDLDPRTLLPLRVIERRGGVTQSIRTLTFRRGVARVLPRVRTSGRVYRQDERYMRMSPMAVAGSTSLDVKVPTALPSGMRLAESGHVKRSVEYGIPVGEFPRGPMYFARWSRGLEQVHLTSRPATAKIRSLWKTGEPIGMDCEKPTRTDVTVGGHPAQYAVGETGNARLWWVDDRTAWTLTGPHSADQLVAIAESLKTVATASSQAQAAADQAGASPVPGPSFGPTVQPKSLTILGFDHSSNVTIAWRSQLRQRATWNFDDGPGGYQSVEDVTGAVRTAASGQVGALRNGTRTVRFARSSPDGTLPTDQYLMDLVWPLLARMRSGEHVLRSARIGNRVTWRATFPLAANTCAGERSGTATLDVAPRTLIPVRYVEKRLQQPRFTFRFQRLTPRASDLGPLKIGGRITRLDESHATRTLNQASSHVSFDVKLPSAIPNGFRIVSVQTAPSGRTLGPEASFPRSGPVLLLRWSRGLESLDMTVRRPRGTLTADWAQSDPFAGECATAVTTTVPLDDATIAKHAIGERGAPRMWWRSGGELYTLSGPFSSEQLAVIARSVTPVERSRS